jgi:RNA-directed DNA polymerase
LKPRQTRIRQTLEAVEGAAGFACLGCNIRHDPSRVRRGDKTRIQPSRAAVPRHHRQVREVTTRCRMPRQSRRIEALTPVIRGWRHDCATVGRQATLGQLDDRVRQR